MKEKKIKVPKLPKKKKEKAPKVPKVKKEKKVDEHLQEMINAQNFGLGL